MISMVAKIFGTFLRDIIIFAFYLFFFFFISPIMLFVIFILVSRQIKNNFTVVLILFIVCNILISIFVTLSSIFWIHGVIHDISFTYVLYNIIRVEWLYLVPLWLFFLYLGIMRLIHFKEKWNEWTRRIKRSN